MANIVKPTELEDASSQNIIHLDLKNTENVHIRYEAKRLLKQVKCTDKEKLLFKGALRKFIIALKHKLLEKSAIKYRFVRGLTCFDPKVIKHQPEGANKRVDVLLEIMHESDKIKRACG